MIFFMINTVNICIVIIAMNAIWALSTLGKTMDRLMEERIPVIMLVI